MPYAYKADMQTENFFAKVDHSIEYIKIWISSLKFLRIFAQAVDSFSVVSSQGYKYET